MDDETYVTADLTEAIGKSFYHAADKFAVSDEVRFAPKKVCKAISRVAGSRFARKCEPTVRNEPHHD
jgi:hypothetical protein